MSVLMNQGYKWKGIVLICGNYDEVTQDTVIYENGELLFGGEAIELPPRYLLSLLLEIMKS
ncbi:MULTISPECIES: hypothetical protein [Bacillus]|uniref:hypothetical protein n=1 Tax=Bacillus TaxID=1386 RepID=UPI000BB905C1|nr:MULTISPECIES: hypothetical protein [Bacillus]